MENSQKNMSRRTTLLMVILTCLLAFQVPVHAAPVSAEVVFPVTVSVSGKTPLPLTEYTVRLTALDHAPLPDSETDHADLVFTESGTADFPPITYQTVGIYHYTISQLTGDCPDMDYDTGVYTVTVTVIHSEDENGLKAAFSLIKGGKKQDGAEFVNHYTGNPVLGDNDPPPPDVPPVEPPADEPEIGPVDEPPAEPPIDKPPVEPPAKPSDPLPNRPDVPPENMLIQTGQLNRPVLLFVCAGVVLMILGGVLMGRSRKKDGDA